MDEPKHAPKSSPASWQSRVGPALTPFTRFSKPLLEAINCKVDAHGEVDLPVPEGWRKGKPLVPHHLPMARPGQAEPFSSALRGKKPGKALVLWLHSDLLGVHARCAQAPASLQTELRREAQEFAQAVAEARGIERLESRLYFPDTDFRKRTHQVASAALILATDESEFKKLDGLPGLMRRERKAERARQIPEDWKTVVDANSEQVAVGDLLQYQCGRPQLVDCPDGVLRVTNPRSGTTNTIPLDLTAAMPFQPREALVLWLSPDSLPAHYGSPVHSEKAPHKLATQELQRFKDAYGKHFRTANFQMVRMAPLERNAPHPLLIFSGAAQARQELTEWQAKLNEMAPRLTPSQPGAAR